MFNKKKKEYLELSTIAEELQQEELVLDHIRETIKEFQLMESQSIKKISELRNRYSTITEGKY